MYISDERFRKNIDQYDQRLAQFMFEGIKEYCKR